MRTIKRYELLTLKGILALSVTIPLMALAFMLAFWFGCLLLMLH